MVSDTLQVKAINFGRRNFRSGRNDFELGTELEKNDLGRNGTGAKRAPPG